MTAARAGLLEGVRDVVDDTNEGTISRREMMRRGAAPGTTVAVATPVVQGLGRIGAFAQVSPPPPTNDRPSLPSHIQLAITFGGSDTR